MSNHAPLAVSGDGYKFSLVPKAIQLRDEAIKTCQEIISVNSEDGLKKIIESVAVLKGIVAGCEVCRKERKAPLLDECEEIDSISKEFKAPAQAEIDRREKIAGAYISEQRRIAEEARRKQEQEAREAQQAEQLRLDAIAEQERLAAQAKGKAAREKAEAEAKRLREIQEQHEIDQAEAAPVAPVEIPKATGAAVGTKIEIFATDLDALYKAHPQCVELTIRLNAVKDLVKHLQRQKKELVLPGVEISIVPDLTVRANRSAGNLLQ